MAGDWIKVLSSTPDKPEVHSMAHLLGIDPDAVVGKLIRIWIWADQHVESCNANVTLAALHDRYINVTRSLLDRITGADGFTDALISVGWLEVEGDKLYFPNFDRHNGNTAKSRALTADRVQKSRDSRNADVTLMYQKCNAANVTSALPEKRREEKRLNTLTTSYEVVSTVPCSKQEPVAYAEGSYATAGGKEVQIEQRHVDRWVKTYGDRVDVRHELAKIQAYLVANPQKRPRNAGGVVKFITNWLNRTDERERRDARASPAAPTPAVSRVVSPLEALRPKNGASNGPGGF